jgi:hypothetical protein
MNNADLNPCFDFACLLGRLNMTGATFKQMFVNQSAIIGALDHSSPKVS